MLIAHDIAGTGDPVLLLHAGVADRRMFQPQWKPLLAAGYRVLRVDLRGFGETPAPTGRYDNADDVRAVLDAHGIERAAVVGLSYGGRIAQEFSARWPDRVSALALVCATAVGRPRTPSIVAFSEREDELVAAGDLDGAVELNVRTFVGPAADDEVRAFVASMQRNVFEVQLAGPDVAGVEIDYDVADITAPTLVVTGGHDLDFFGQVGEFLLDRIPLARAVRLDWAGHLPSLEDPARFNPILLDFLSTVDN